MIYEHPYPVLEADWDAGRPQWREITPLAYQELLQATKLLHQNENGFMQGDPVTILRDGEAACVCCRKSEGFYFDRIMPADEWFYLYALPLPKISL